MTSPPTDAESIDALIKRDIIDAGDRVSKEAALKVLDRKAEALPYLIEMVKGGRYWHTDDENESWVPLTALHLLSLTREREALEAIIYAIYHYTEELGDWLTEDVASLLAYFGEAQFNRIATLVSDNKLDPFARDAAAMAIVVIAEKSGKEALRKAAIECLRNAISTEKDRTARTLLAIDLAETRDRGSLPFIKSLYDRRLIDSGFASYEDAEKICAGHDYLSEREAARKDPMDFFSPHSDTQGEVEGEAEEKDEALYESRHSYKAFRCPDCQTIVWDLARIEATKEAHAYAGAVARRHVDRLGLPYTSIGRNEPCPCGSGKKYKRCCLPSIQRWDIIDRKIDEGYGYLGGQEEGDDEEEQRKSEYDPVKACECWLEAWRMIKNVIGKDAKRINDVPSPFALCQIPSNWVQDFDMELWNASLKERRFHELRIEFSRWFCSQFVCEDEDMLVNFHSSEATSMAALGDINGAERKFEELVSKYPMHVWSWIHWSDAYWLDIPEKAGKKDYDKAESILLRCLEQKGLDERDRKGVEERLSELRKEMTDRREEGQHAS